LIKLHGRFAYLYNNLINLTLNIKKGGTIYSLIDLRTGKKILDKNSNEINFYNDLGGAYSMRITKLLYKSSSFNVTNISFVNGSLLSSIRLTVENGNITFN